ncbi:MAG: PEP-CTERM sorting domain-containing protein [Cyanobacteria bacterium P01_E01_bin.42]
MKSLPFLPNTLFKIAIAAIASINILTPTPTKANDVPDRTLLPDTVTQLILRQAAIDTNLPISELRLESANAVTWPNGCMGLRGGICTQALVDGWQVFVTSNSHKLTYHTNGSGAFLASGNLPNTRGQNPRSLFPVIDEQAWWRWQEWWQLEEEQRRREELLRRWANIGWTQENPVLPQIEEPGIWRFENVPSRRWFDPPTEYGFRYTMLEDSLFTEVLDFPVTIDEDNLFTISVGDTILGEFSPGESVDFVSLLGRGVSEFTITDIDAPLDLEDPTAFPLKLAFNTEFADFEMEAISEPATVPEASTTMGLLALGFIGIYSRFKPRRKFK